MRVYSIISPPSNNPFYHKKFFKSACLSRLPFTYFSIKQIYKWSEAIGCLSTLQVSSALCKCFLFRKLSGCFRRLVLKLASVMSYYYTFHEVTGWLPDHRKVTRKLLASASLLIGAIVQREGFEPSYSFDFGSVAVLPIVRHHVYIILLNSAHCCVYQFRHPCM